MAISLVAYSLALYFTMPAHGLDARNCTAKSSRLKEPERTAYIQSCLAQVSAPRNIKEAELRHKKLLCEQNAKNYFLRSTDKANYVARCMNENKAEAAAKTSAKAESERKKQLAKTWAKARQALEELTDSEEPVKGNKKSKKAPKVRDDKRQTRK